MNSESFDPTQGFYRSAVIAEMQHSSMDMEASVWDYMTMGTASAATSAFIGIANTGIALGEVLGLADGDSYYDEAAIVGKLWGQNTEDFYLQHKTGADVAGMVVGSFVPGLGAIRALRAAQSVGKMWAPAGITSGLRNADILLGSPMVKTAKDSVLRTGTSGLRNKQVRDSYVAGFQQQFMEAAAFELAIATTMNQNAALNPDDLGYFEAAKNVTWESIPFMLAGGTIGGVIDGLRINGAIGKNATAEFERTKKFLVPELEGMTGLPNGDKLVMLAQSKKLHNELAQGIDSGDWFAKQQYNAGEGQIKKHLRAIAMDMNEPGAHTLELVEELFEDAVKGNLDNFTSKIANAKDIGTATVTDMRELARFYNRSMAPTGIVYADAGVDTGVEFTKIQESFGRLLREDLAAQQILDPAGTANAQARGLKRANGNVFAEVAQGKPTGEAFQNLRVSAVSRDGKELLFVPDVIGINPANIEVSYRLTKRYNEENGIKFSMSQDEFANYTLLHEIGHVKTNTTKTLNLIRNMASEGTARELMVDLIEASIKRRRPMWDATGVNVGNPKLDRSLAERLAEEKLYGGTSADGTSAWKSYYGDIKELLADGAAYLAHPKSREAAARQFPTLAKFFDSNGSIAKAWDDTKAYYNRRTGEVVSSTLLGVQDISQGAKLKITTKGMELHSPELGRTFKADPKMFTQISENITQGKLDYLEYDAAWKMYADLDFGDLAKVDPKKNKDGVIKLTSGNLPAMERVVQQSKESDLVAKAFEEGRIRYDGAVISPEQLRTKLLEAKTNIRNELLIRADEGGYNEHHIARILNMDVNRAMGLRDGEMMLYGVKDFSKPEIFRVGYDQRMPLDYSVNSKSAVAMSARREMVREEQERAAALALGTDYQKIADVSLDYRDAGVSFTESRAGMVNALRTTFGSIREKAAYIGKQMNQLKVKKIKEVDEDYANFVETFNRAENAGLRYELANIDNLLRRNWYYPVKTIDPDTGGIAHAIVDKQALQKVLADADMEFDSSLLDEFPAELLDTIRGIGKSGDPSVVSLSEQVGKFYQYHRGKNSEMLGKKRQIAHARGKEAVLDEDVLYPPPRDLKTQKFFAFVQPTRFQAGSDPRSFMIYAETPAEFRAKRELVMQKYGDSYRVVTQEERTDYAKLMGDYDKSLVFDELHFDPSIARKGKASELLPNMDLQTSATLDRYRQWTIRQEESILKSGVELQFDDAIQSLRSLDAELGMAERTAIADRWKEPDSIWKDTVNLMLDQKSHGGALQETFVRVNDFIGDAGSKVLDGALGSLRKPKSTPITSRDLHKFNSDLQAAGYNPPTLTLMETILSSPETTKSATLPNLVRTMSNLTSTLMLRLDMAHSMMQTISTPILALPVIQEAKAALRGTENGRKLDSLTSVVNPANGVAEPTAAKLFADGTKAFFSPEGKEFMQGLRDRNIVSDYLIQYLDTLDFSAFNGSHNLRMIGDKIDKVADFGSKFSGFRLSEEFTRFQVAWAVKQVGELRGYSAKEMWPTVSSAVDKVHGVYLGNQRVQLFQGVLGQAVGLYQTYFFNFVQNMAKFAANGDRTQALTMAAMQTSLFGVQSLPGFHQLNQLIGETNTGNLDLYSVSGADDPNSTAAYFMYGLGSHLLGFPVDFYSRGDLAVRHSTVIPTSLKDFPVVSTIAKAIGNVANTVDLATSGDVSVGQALVHGLAHNGMNRPMQGVGNIIRGAIMSNKGQVNFDNSNYVDYNMANELNWGAMFARVIGTRPLNEAIIQGNYFRDAAYQANQRRSLDGIAKKLQINLNTGTVTNGLYEDLAQEYEAAGGNIQNFNAFWTRQLKNATRPTMTEFQRELMLDSELARSRSRLELEQSAEPQW